MSERFCIASYFFRDAVTKTALDAKRLIIRVLGAAGLAWLALASMTGQAAASAGCDRFTGATDVGWINYGVSTYSSGKLSAFAAGDRLKIRASATPAPSFFVKKSWDQLSFLTSADGVIELAITAQMINAYPDGVLNISANANDVSLLLSCSGVPSPTAPPPGLSSISVAPYDKAASTLAGGGAATITGSNLSDVTRVKFGAATATITSKADTSISVTVPASAAAGVSSSGGDVTVVASNNGGDSSALAFTYAPPVVVSNPNAAYSAPADATVSVDFSAAVFSGGYGRLTYSATGLPAGFSIDSGSGVVSGRATYVPKTTIRVTATDQIGQSNASSIDFQTNPPRLQASARSIPPLYVGVAASEAGGVGFYPVEMTGGYSVPPGYVFSEPQGRLANLGLTLAADGKVTGAPAATFNGAITLAINDQANQSVTQDFTLVVHKAPQTVSITSTAPTPAVISGTYQVVATSVRTNGGASTGLRPRISVSGDACTIDANNLVTFTAAGTCTVSASITNDATFADASASAPVISVGKKPQIIVLTSTPPASARVNDAYQIAGYLMRGDTRVDNADVTTATNTDVCTVNNALVTMKAMGTCTITVSKAGDATYDAAPVQTQTIPVVGKAAQDVAFTSTAPTSAKIGATYAPTTISRIAGTQTATGLTPVIGASGACSLTNGVVTFTAAGTCTVSASITNDATYAGASASAQVISVGKAAQDVAITSTAPTGAKIGATYAPTATSRIAGTQTATGLTPVIGASGACSLTNGVVTFTAAGNCSVSASITNDATYADTSAAAQVISVGKKPQTIVLTSTPPASARVTDAYQIAGYLMRDATRVDNADVTTATNTDVCTVNNALVTMKATGTCTITVSKAGDATYDAAPPLTQTIPVVGKAAHMLASDAISAPSGAAAGGSYKPILKTSSAGLTPVLTSSAASICRVDADGTVRFLSAGKCTLMATAGNGDYADVSARLDITVAPANQPVATTVTLQASPTRPLVGQKMLLTASVTPLAATGTVTFRDGAAVIGSVMVSGGKASVTTGAMSAGAHAITAAYSGDAIYAPATSAAAAITPTAPPNPTSDKSVRAIVATQSATAQRVVSRQLDTVQRRLEFLHDDNGASFVNGLSISAPSGLPPGASPFDDPVLRGQGFSRSEAGQALDRTLDRSFGKFATAGQDWDAPAKAKPDGDRFSPLEASGFKVWTSGSVIFGGVTVSALGVETKTHFTLSGITAGVDTRLMEGLKGGFAVSYSGQSDDLGADGSRMDSRTLTGSLYASWRVADKVFLDGSIGYGDLFFSSKRLDGNGAGFIRGERRGKLLFGSLALSYDETLGPLKLSPYARLDGSNASLNAYAETGADDWTLSYDKATLASQSLALGLRGQYDIEQPWGTLSPTWRAEYGRLLSGDLTQMVSYATDASTRYAMTTAASDRDSLSAALGLKARSKRDVTGALEYLLSGGLRTGVQGQGLRGMLRVGF